jgi:urocanate hydratase
MRHADAGYDLAVEVAREHRMDLPMLPEAAEEGSA